MLDDESRRLWRLVTAKDKETKLIEKQNVTQRKENEMEEDNEEEEEEEEFEDNHMMNDDSDQESLDDSDLSSSSLDFDELSSSSSIIHSSPPRHATSFTSTDSSTSSCDGEIMISLESIEPAPELQEAKALRDVIRAKKVCVVCVFFQISISYKTFSFCFESENYIMEVLRVQCRSLAITNRSATPSQAQRAACRRQTHRRPLHAHRRHWHRHTN